jgi:calcineurin-like phosphoesterase family protein
VLGDIALSKTKVPLASQLNGHKHLIVGNHDYHNLKDIKKLNCFESIKYMDVINLDGKIITLCHFPVYSFIGEYMVYGHVHNNEKDECWINIRKSSNDK